MPRTASVSPYFFQRSTTRTDGAALAPACSSRIGSTAMLIGFTDRSFLLGLSGMSRPLIALDKDFPVGGHSGLRESKAGFELQLETDDLLDAVIFEVSVFGSKCRLWVDA